MIESSWKRQTPTRMAFFSRAGRKFALFAFFAVLLVPTPGFPWTIHDYNPWKQIRDHRIFSLTRSNPVGTRILVIPVLDEPVNAPVYTRICTEFTNQLRSFASEVWLITDLPDGPVKQGFYTGLSRILADYRLKNRLSMDLISTMIPDFECDFIALFEVTGYDRYWIDHDLQHRVGLRCVLYDYEDGGPRIEKYFEGGRGRKLEEGAFSEAERAAVKGLVEELERPLRKSIAEREEELRRRSTEIDRLASMTVGQEWAIHQYDLGYMKGRMAADQDRANAAERTRLQVEQERDYWKQQAEAHKRMLEEQKQQAAASTAAGGAPTVIHPNPRRGFQLYRNPFVAPRAAPCPPGANSPQAPSTGSSSEVLPSPYPPRMPTLKPIDMKVEEPGPLWSPPVEGGAATIAYKEIDQLPRYDAENDPFLIPAWEEEIPGEWEFVGNEP